MADDADLAQARAEREEDQRRRYKPASQLEAEATGFCLYCQTKLPKPKRWCDSYCLKDWETYIKGK
jgi:hypothetical protein